MSIPLPTTIMHITHRNDWDAAVSTGYYTPSSLTTDGFIHCSTIEQTVSTANQFFTNQRHLLLVCIDTQKVDSDIKFERPACPGDQRKELLFPHIFGPLNISAVTQIVEFPPNFDGTFSLPAEITRDATIPDDKPMY